MKRTGFVIAICVVLLVCSQAFAEGKKVMFFEAALAPTDMTSSVDPTGFSKLASMLQDSGMLVASMSIGEITRPKLAPYDIVTLHPSPERPLRGSEISALVWFVAQKGGALFIHGGSARIVNPLTEIFGVSMDASNLVDTTSAISESSDGREFLLTQLSGGPDFGFGEIDSISFHGGPPLVLSHDAQALIIGDADCYSDNGLYSLGSFPPVCAITYLGRGVVVVKSDRNMLDNTNIGNYGNKDWAKAIFDRLSSLQDARVERDSSLVGLRAQVIDHEKRLAVAAEKLRKLESDLAMSYEKGKDLEQKLRDAEKTNKGLTTKLEVIKKERDEFDQKLAQYKSPETLKVVGIGAAVVLVLILAIGFLLGRKSVRSRV